MRRLALTVSALTSSLVLAACGTGATSSAGSTPSPAPSAAAMAGMGSMGGMDMSGTTPALTPDAGATGSPVAAATGSPVAAETLKAIAASLNSVSGVSYTFAVTGSDMMSMWPSGQGQLAGSALDANAAKVVTMGYDSGAMEFRSVNGQLYVKSARYDQGKSWAVVPADTTGNAAAAGLQTQLDQLDPRVELQLLLAAPNIHQTDEGTTVAGATHYVGEVTAAQLTNATALTAAQRSMLGSIYPSLSIKPLSIDVWVDSQQRPVRLEVVSPTPGGALDLVMSFSGYGTPVSLATPAPTIPLPADA